MVDLQVQFDKLLEQYAVLQKGLVGKKIEAFHDLIGSYRIAHEEYRKKTKGSAPDFNPITLLGLKYNELAHSRILAWLFDPEETHSQGDLFFRHFLAHFEFEVVYDPWDYKVKREQVGKDAIIDILVYGRSFIFYIENKTLASEGHDQTNREYRDLKKLSKALNVNNIFPLFLTPQGDPPENKKWKPISYYQLAEAFEEALAEIQEHYVKRFVGSWIATLKSIEV